MPGLEGARGRLQRIDGGVDPLLHDRRDEDDRRVEVRERGRRSRVREVVGRHVDRLHGGHRPGRRRGDPLLQLAHLGRERRLVADGARHAPEERRDFGARLDEPEDVVDEEQHVLALVAEVLGHRQPGEADAQARARRLVHLPVDEGDLVHHARIPSSRARGRCPRACARRRPAKTDTPPCCNATLWMSSWMRTVLPVPAPPKSPTLPPFTNGAIRSIDLDPGLEGLHLRREVAEGRRVAVNGPALHVVRRRPRLVDRLADHVPEPPERRRPDGDGDRAPVSTQVAPRAKPSVESIATARTRSSPRCCCTSATSVRDSSPSRDLDLERACRSRGAVGEDGVDDDALDLDDLARVRAVRSVLGHGSPDAKGLGGGSPRAGRGVYRGAPPRAAATRAWLENYGAKRR